MIAFLLDIYLLAVWLIFIRLKLLTFNLPAKITVGVVGAVGIFGILIAVNFLHPQSMDARVFQHLTQVASRTSQAGRVTEVRVQPNVPVKKGETLFVIDSRPYEAEVERLQAALAAAEQNVPQLKAAYEAALAGRAKAQGQLELAIAEEARDKKLLDSKAVSKEDYEVKVRNLALSKSSLTETTALAEKARLAFSAKTAAGENVDVAQLKAELKKAQIDLEETIVRAPADGYVTNLQLQPGYIVRPGDPVMTFVVQEAGIIVVTMPQEYLGAIEVGNEVEVCLDVYPGRTLQGEVESLILVAGSGQLAPSGELPTATSIGTAARFPIRVKLKEGVAKQYRLPGGAHGAAAIYTNHGTSFKIVRRVVLRWYTWLNFLKLSM